MKKISFLFGCILLCIHGVQSQQNKEAMTPVHELLAIYINTVNTIKKEGNINKIMDLYSDRYSGNTTYVKLSGGIVKKSYKKEDIKKQLDELIQDDQYNIRLSTKQVLYENQKEKAGTISALLDFTSTIDGELAEKGTMLINIVAVLQNNQWKIIQNNMVRVSETKDIGDCVCHIYSKGGTKFITELYYPAGMTYQHKFEAFQFVVNGNSSVIKTLNGTFIWDKSTGTVVRDQKEIGTAKDQKKVLEMIIENTNTEACSKMIFR